MKVVTLKDILNVPMEGAAEPIEGWKGPVSRSRQTIIQPASPRITTAAARPRGSSVRTYGPPAGAPSRPLRI
jgi:hypothetical protein